jgi:hypothetical protein
VVLPYSMPFTTSTGSSIDTVLRDSLQYSYLTLACLNEAPPNKLWGITELKHAELLELLARLPLSLDVPIYRLPVRTFVHRRHIVPICPKLPTPQHPLDHALSPTDLSRNIL